MSDRRKHIRVEHRDQVEIIAANGKIAATGIDLSRSGMSIVVNIPESFDDVRRITFTLPWTSERLSVPCRVVREDPAESSSDSRILALAFEYEAAAQMLLVENYIRDRKALVLKESVDTADARRVPRTDCDITDVAISGSSVTEVSIDNISTEGMLLSFRGSALSVDDTPIVRFFFPGDNRPLEVPGRVMYVVNDGFEDVRIAGFQFQNLKEPVQARIRNFVVSAAARSSVQSVHRWLARNGTAKEFRVSEEDTIRTLLSGASEDGIPLHAIIGDSYTIVDLHLKMRRNSRTDRLEIVHDAELAAGEVSCSFSSEGHSYYFRSRIEEFENEFTLRLPSELFRSDKRSSGRKKVDHRIVLKPAADPGVSAAGRILDISRRGFLCEVRVADSAGALFAPGALIGYQVDERLALGTQGEIRHTVPVAGANGSAIVRIGVEAGVARSNHVHSVYDADRWERERAIVSAKQENLPADYRLRSVRIPAPGGKYIAAIIGANRWHCSATVIILPPAFGKKKETLAPLFSVLAANFSAAERDLVVIRYDGIDRPGESSQTVAGRARGYEMLDYRISQGQNDMQSVLDFVYDNPHFIAEKVVLVTFSMSALDGRKLISSEQNRDRIHFWISVMGVPSAQHTLTNIMGGMDILAHFQMGIPTGVSGILGHLVDMDRLAEDLVTNDYAFLTDARYDMARIALPVLWICGTYDKWVPAEEIHDIMSIASGEDRELLEIPTGHNLHTSDDAILAFKLITRAVFSRLFADNRSPVDPNREEMLRLIAYERERLDSTEMTDIGGYWRDYLIGQGSDSEGYDFYRNIKEFRSFLYREAALLGPRPGDRIADMGCGTGLFLEALLQFLGRSWATRPERAQIEITAVDLVEEALEKAKEKVQTAVAEHPALSDVRMTYVRRDLQPDRLIPVRRFLESKSPDLNTLRGRIAGLKHEMIDQLTACTTEAVSALMRGAGPTHALIHAARAAIGQPLLDVVLEFNRAARFVRRTIVSADLTSPDLPGGSEAQLPPERYATLRTNDLRFNTLLFSNGNSGEHPETTGSFPDQSFDRIMASLFISYLFMPEEILPEFYRLLTPGGTLVVSSMKPDSDISVIFTDFVKEVHWNEDAALTQDAPGTEASRLSAESRLSGARSMLNEAAALFELEEEGFFAFFTAEQLETLLLDAGFVDVTVEQGLGTPAQAVIARGRRPE